MSVSGDSGAAATVPRRFKSTYERVDGLETSLHGLVHGLSGDDTGGLELDSLAKIALDGAVAIDGVAEGVDNTTEHALTDGDIDDRTCSLDNITFLDLSKCIKDKYIFRQLPKIGRAHV